MNDNFSGIKPVLDLPSFVSFMVSVFLNYDFALFGKSPDIKAVILSFILLISVNGYIFLPEKISLPIIEYFFLGLNVLVGIALATLVVVNAAAVDEVIF